MQGAQIVANIKAIAKKKGVKLLQLYKDCEISPAALSQWKTGKTSPSMPSLERIARYLDVPLSDLLAGGEKKEEPVGVTTDGLDAAISSLSPELREQFVRLLALAERDPDRAARYLAFLTQELGSQQ